MNLTRCLPATSTSSVTPIPSTNEPTSRITPTLRNCNWAEFVRDVTMPDGTKIKGGDTFSKTWRLRNIGDCPWKQDYNFVFVGGEAFNAPNKVGLPTFVGPGEMVDITILLEAPTYLGNYRGYFMLADRQSDRFGSGVLTMISTHNRSSAPAPVPKRSLCLSASI
ncbi:MAG: NBR1-Ig-like domain-containing protein, partial [Chloroflexota bacterium]|nr:NBR1-Ig-like domain-containing protein [Chloroflexota bacterium]